MEKLVFQLANMNMINKLDECDPNSHSFFMFLEIVRAE